MDRLSDVETELDDLLAEHGQEGGLLEDAVGEKGGFTTAAVEARNLGLRASLAAAQFPDEFEAASSAAKAFEEAAQKKAIVEHELGAPGGALAHVSGAKGTFTKRAVSERLKAFGSADTSERRDLVRADEALAAVATTKANLKALRTALDMLVDAAPTPDDEFSEERTMLSQLQEVLVREAEIRTAVKAAREALDEALAVRYQDLRPAEVAELAADAKWLQSVSSIVVANLDALARALSERVRQVALRYAEPMPELVMVSAQLQARVDEDLKLMGMTW
jgi:type I restriction enzyme M protein